MRASECTHHKNQQNKTILVSGIAIAFNGYVVWSRFSRAGLLETQLPKLSYAAD